MMKKHIDYNKKNIEAIKSNNFELLLKINSRWINQTASRKAYSDNWLFEEYRAIINIGFYKAFTTYKIDSNDNFLGYAQRIIMNDLNSYFHKFTNTIKLNRATRQMVEDGKVPAIKEISDYNDEVAEGISIIDCYVVPTDKVIDMSAIINSISELRLKKPRWAEIVEKYHGLYDKKPRAFSHISKDYNLTNQAICDQYHQAIKWLKKNERLKFQFKLDNE